MKKTKLLTSIAALALVFSLGACEGDININIDGGVNIGGDESSSDTEDTESSESTSEEGTSSDTGSDLDEPLTEEELEIAKDILSAAVSKSSTGYNGFDPLKYFSVAAYGGGQITYNIYDIEHDENGKIYGLRRIYDQDCTKESDAKFHYIVDGVDYYYNGVLAKPSYTTTNVAYTNFNNFISGAIGSGYYGAFDDASTIDLELATGAKLVSEANGNYELTLTYNGIWYIYEADTSFNLTGAGYYTGVDLGDYASSSGYEFYYGGLSDEATIESAMEDFDITLWIPETGEETKTNAEKALEFIEAVDDKTQALTEISWDAFHYYDGEAGGLFDEEISEEGWLTTQNGKLYGYIDEIDDDEMEEYHTYYQNGVRFYDNDGSKSYSETYTQTYDGLLDTQLDNAYEVFEVLEDAVEAASEDDIVLSGTTLTITATSGSIDPSTGGSSSTTTYVLASDASYNLTKISSEKVKTDVYVSGQTATTTTKYLLEKKNVGEIALPTDFDPEDFGYIPQTTPETGEATVADVIDVLNTVGGAFNYGDGFYYECIDYTLDAYTDVLINATNDGNGVYTQQTYNFSGDGETLTFSQLMSVYTDGTNTYYYDDDGLETYPNTLLYSYSTYIMYATLSFAYMDYEEIISQLGTWANKTDVYNDIELEDGSIEFMGYNEELTEMAILYATYDENGFEYFIYEYTTETEAYAVMLYPEDSVEVPSWLS